MGWETPPAQVASNAVGQPCPANTGGSEGLHSVRGPNRTCPGLSQEAVATKRSMCGFRSSVRGCSFASHTSRRHTAQRGQESHQEEAVAGLVTCETYGEVLGREFATRDGSGCGDSHHRNAISIAISAHAGDQASLQQYLHEKATHRHAERRVPGLSSADKQRDDHSR